MPKENIGVNTFNFDSKYYEFVENLAEGIWTIDSNAYTTYVNRAMANMLGYTPQEMLGKHLFDFMDEEAVLSAKYYLMRRSEGIKENHYFEFTHKSGHKVYTQINTYPLIDNNGTYYGALAAITDLTEKRKFEETKQILEKKFSSIFELFSICLMIINKELRIIDANKKMTQLLNCSKEEILNKNILAFFPKEYHTDLTAQFYLLLDEKLERIMGEYKIVLSDRIIQNVFVTFFSIKTSIGTASEILISIIDKTEEKNYEHELAKNEALFRSVLEHSTAAISIWDRDIKNIYANKRAVSLFGRNLDPISKGQSLKEVMELYGMPEYYEKWSARIKEGFNSGLIKYYSDEAIVDGVKVFSENTIIPIKNVNGQVFAVEVIFRDVTQQKKLEHELLEKEKLASIGKMAAYLSHEIRSPLAAISINLELLKQGTNLSQKKLKSLSIIDSELERLNSLLSDILKFSSEIKLSKSVFYLNETVDKINQLLKQILKEKNINFLNKVDPVQIFADANKIEGIIIDLIKNSIDAIKDKGKIEIYSSSENGFINLFIKDSGCGIEEPEKIFDTFYTTKKNGTGLGLPIAKSILEKHGGSIKLLSSKPGETIFLIKLPKNEKKEI